MLLLMNQYLIHMQQTTTRQLTRLSSDLQLLRVGCSLFSRTWCPAFLALHNQTASRARLKVPVQDLLLPYDTQLDT